MVHYAAVGKEHHPIVIAVYSDESIHDAHGARYTFDVSFLHLR